MRRRKLLKLLHLLARILQCLRRVEMTLLKLDSLVLFACKPLFFLGAMLVLGLWNNLSLGALPVLGIFEQFIALIYIYIYICLFPLCLCCFQVLSVCTFCLCFSSSIGDLEKFWLNYESCQFNSVDDFPSSSRSIHLSFRQEYLHPSEEPRPLGT